MNVTIWLMATTDNENMANVELCELSGHFCCYNFTTASNRVDTHRVDVINFE